MEHAEKYETNVYATKPHHDGHIGTAMGGWGIVLFIGFLVILWGVWNHCNRSNDQHLTSIRTADQTAYQNGYIQKQLNDMQYQLSNFANREENHYEADLRFGQPCGVHTQVPCAPRGRYPYGGINNGSNFTQNDTFAAENSVFA